MTGASITLHNCKEVRAKYVPTWEIEGGLLRLFFVREGSIEELTLFGLPSDQARAIAAVCVPCDHSGFPVHEAEPPAPLVPRPEHGRTYRETMPQRDYGDECDSSEAA